MAMVMDRHGLAVVTLSGNLWLKTSPPGASDQEGEVTLRHCPIPSAHPVLLYSSSLTGGAQACVLADGSLWTWGNNYTGMLGHGDRETLAVPTRVDGGSVCDSLVVMAACAQQHLLVLTDDGRVHSCGSAKDGRLGQVFAHPAPGIPDALIPPAAWFEYENRATLAVVGADDFRATRICMVAAGDTHSVALDDNGFVWTWGLGCYGALGFSDTAALPVPGHRLLPARLPLDALGNNRVVQIAADSNVSLAVAADGVAVWAWGRMHSGNSRVPRRVANTGDFGGARVCSAACAKSHFVVVTSDGALWTWGVSRHGALGHGREHRHIRVPRRIEGAPRCVAVAAALNRSAALSEDGHPYYWGRFGPDEPRRYFPEILLQQTVGPFAPLNAVRALSFAMGGHARLGAGVQGVGGVSVCPFLNLSPELVELVAITARGGPEGRIAQLEGVMRLLGGGFRYSRGVTRKPKHKRGMPMGWPARVKDEEA
jgi:alpha-tubulin suppressor-like RCC1 family protein